MEMQQLVVYTVKLMRKRHSWDPGNFLTSLNQRICSFSFQISPEKLVAFFYWGTLHLQNARCLGKHYLPLASDHDKVNKQPQQFPYGGRTCLVSLLEAAR